MFKKVMEFTKDLFKVGRCCGDCKYYDTCFVNIPQNELNFETPACKEFKERD